MFVCIRTDPLSIACRSQYDPKASLTRFQVVLMVLATAKNTRRIKTQKKASSRVGTVDGQAGVLVVPGIAKPNKMIEYCGKTE